MHGGLLEIGITKFSFDGSCIMQKKRFAPSPLYSGQGCTCEPSPQLRNNRLTHLCRNSSARCALQFFLGRKKGSTFIPWLIVSLRASILRDFCMICFRVFSSVARSSIRPASPLKCEEGREGKPQRIHPSDPDPVRADRKEGRK